MSIGVVESPYGDFSSGESYFAADCNVRRLGENLGFPVRTTEGISDINVSVSLLYAALSGFDVWWFPGRVGNGMKMFDGSKDGVIARVEEFSSLVELLKQYSPEFSSNPFSLMSDRRCVGVGFSPVIVPEMRDAPFLAGSVRDLVRNAAECMCPEFLDMYELSVLSLQETLYSPGSTLTVLFMRRDCIL